MTGCACPDHPEPCRRKVAKGRRVCSPCRDYCPPPQEAPTPADLAESEAVDGWAEKDVDP